MITTEYLNMLEVSGWPPHKLMLKVGTPVMPLCNLDSSNRLVINYIIVDDESGAK